MRSVERFSCRLLYVASINFPPAILSSELADSDLQLPWTSIVEWTGAHVSQSFLTEGDNLSYFYLTRNGF